jgi:hypothetical protein
VRRTIRSLRAGFLERKLFAEDPLLSSLRILLMDDCDAVRSGICDLLVRFQIATPRYLSLWNITEIADGAHEACDCLR